MAAFFARSVNNRFSNVPGNSDSIKVARSVNDQMYLLFSQLEAANSDNLLEKAQAFLEFLNKNEAIESEIDNIHLYAIFNDLRQKQATLLQQKLAPSLPPLHAITDNNPAVSPLQQLVGLYEYLIFLRTSDNNSLDANIVLLNSAAKKGNLLAFMRLGQNIYQQLESCNDVTAIQKLITHIYQKDSVLKDQNAHGLLAPGQLYIAEIHYAILRKLILFLESSPSVLGLIQKIREKAIQAYYCAQGFLTQCASNKLPYDYQALAKPTKADDFFVDQLTCDNIGSRIETLEACIPPRIKEQGVCSLDKLRGIAEDSLKDTILEIKTIQREQEKAKKAQTLGVICAQNSR